jgi:riboflavin synthase
MTLSRPPESQPFLVGKGSVAVDGVSLTVAAAGGSSFEIELIPLTLQDTTLGRLRPGDEVNLEYDIIGKYVYNWLNREKR